MNPLLLNTAVFLVSVAGLFVASKITGFIWRRVFVSIAARTRTTIDEMLVRATEKPVMRLILVAGLKVIVDTYLRSSLRFSPDTFLRERLQTLLAAGTVGRVFSVFIILVSASLVHAIAKTLARWYMDRIDTTADSRSVLEFMPLIDKLSGVVIYFIAITMILPVLGKNISGLLATAGIASLAVAFAAQETLANLISGFSIMLDKPFRQGDRIELPDGLTGDVVDIGLRTTRILSFDNTLIVVPNTEISRARVVNHSYPDDRVKIRPQVGVSYDTDIDRAKQLLYEVCRSHPKVLDDPEPAVYFMEFGDSALQLVAICWIADYRDRFRTLDEINTEIKKAFDREGIEIPFPQRVVHLQSGQKSPES